MQNLFNQSLESFISGICEGRPELEKAKDKVGATLKSYEDYRGHGLRVADVYLDSAGGNSEVLTRRCLDFIDSQPLPPDRDKKRHERRKSEDKSILRRFMREFRSPGPALEPEQVSLADMENLPPEWEVLKEILPRSVPNTERSRVSVGIRSKEDFPYSFAAQHVALALRQVSKEAGHLVLDILFGELYGELTRAMRRNVPHCFHRSLTVQFSLIRKAYFSARGVPVPGRKISIPLEEFPEPLRSQVESYERQAKRGYGASKDLRRIAEKNGFQEEAYEESTVDGMIDKLRLGLGYIFEDQATMPATLSIEDLIRTHGVEEKDKTGRIRGFRFVNDYVEIYYQKQFYKRTPSKREEFDTAGFGQFRVAVSSVAFVNGFEDYIEDFREGYATHLDLKTREEKKSKKKHVFDRAKVDQEILRLQSEVGRIVESGSFKMSRVGKDDDVHALMTKVLFFVNVVVLRYLGYRQQCLRACKLREHIIFHADKSITLDFPKTKNKKHIRIKLSPKQHGHTHKMLLDTLWMYHDRVYPYIRERDGGVKGHFFVAVSPDTGLFKRYTNQDVFTGNFREWGKIHLHYEKFEGAQDENLTLHPHFFRGCCVDWLLEDLGMSRDEVATFIGDDPDTLKAYINANKIHDATACLTKANRALRAESNERDGRRLRAEAKDKLREYRKAVKAKDNQLQDAWDELKKMRQLVEREKDEKDGYLRENRELQRRVSLLESENLQLPRQPVASA